GALLWALHPMRVEDVAWCTTRTYCQSMFFLMLCAVMYVRSRDPASSQARRSGWYWSSVAAYLFSLLSYPLGLTLPAALLVADIHPLRLARIGSQWSSDPQLRRCVVSKLPFAAAAAVVLVLGLMARFHHSAVYSSQTAGLDEFGLMQRLM